MCETAGGSHPRSRFRRTQPVDYVAPTTVEEAVGALASQTDARVFAGATDLIPQIRAGRPEPGLLVDLKRIDRLTAVAEGATSWTIGAATPTSRLTENATFSSEFPGLSEAAGLIGSDQIQNRSSLGGNLCNASPAADSVPALLINEARAVVATSDGTRTIAGRRCRHRSRGYFPREHGRVHRRVRSRQAAANTADAYLRMIPSHRDGHRRRRSRCADHPRRERQLRDRPASPWAPSHRQRCECPTPRLPLPVKPINDDTLAAVAAGASAACNPIDDKRGTIAYRKQVAGVLAKTSGQACAAERAGNGPTNGAH